VALSGVILIDCCLATRQHTQSVRSGRLGYTD